MRKEVEDLKFKLSKGQIQEYTQMMISSYLKDHPISLIENSRPVELLDGVLFLSGYNRIVIGAHGPYIEFEECHLLLDLYIPENEIYRIFGEYYVKYIHKQPIGRDEKIYLQSKVVDYADYEVGKYYIDFYLTSLSKINKDSSTNLNGL